MKSALTPSFGTGLHFSRLQGLFQCLMVAIAREIWGY